MKLVTTIKPRTNGTVTVRNDAGEAFKFEDDGSGILACDVPDSALVTRLLTQNSGNDFMPFGDEEMAAARALLATRPRSRPVTGQVDPDDEDLDDEPDQNAPPVERADLDAALAALPGEYTDADFVVNGMRSYYGTLFTDADAERVRELVKPVSGAPAAPDQEQAAGQAPAPAPTPTKRPRAS